MSSSPVRPTRQSIRLIETSIVGIDGTELWAVFAGTPDPASFDLDEFFFTEPFTLLKTMLTSEYSAESIFNTSIGSLLAPPQRRSDVLLLEHVLDPGGRVRPVGVSRELQRLGETERESFQRKFQNEAASIAIEQSPPQLADIGSIIRSGSGVAIGAYAGFMAAEPSYSYLLLITVPAGILLCSTAVGLGRGIEGGLSDGMKGLLKRRLAFKAASDIRRGLESLDDQGKHPT